jgi:hypothetical protein
MNHDDRVLTRAGARELSAEEVARIGGGVQTFLITFGPNGRDGDGYATES